MVEAGVKFTIEKGVVRGIEDGRPIGGSRGVMVGFVGAATVTKVEGGLCVT